MMPTILEYCLSHLLEIGANNDGTDYCYPASYDNVVSVASIDSTIKAMLLLHKEMTR